MLRQIPLLGDQSKNRIARVNDQIAVNLEPLVQKPNAKTQLAMMSSPGLTLLGTAGDGVGRSNWVKFNDNIYYINGTKLVEVDTSNNATVIGSLETADVWCVMAAGRSDLLIVDGKNGYTYDGTTFAKITDADFPSSPTHCVYLSGRFIVNKGGSDEFYISAVEDPTSWGALDFASAEANPDDVLAIGATNKDLYLIGKDTTQPFYNSGNADFPFDPYQNVMEIGIYAKYSLAKGATGFFWLAANEEGDAFVVRVSGMQYQVVSDDELSWQINQQSSITDAVGSLFRHNGKTWYELTFPQDDITYVLNVVDGGWHRRKSYGMGRHRASGFGYLNGKILCGDYTNNNFYSLDYDAYDENGATMERIRRTQVIHVDQRQMLFHELVLDMQTGVGINDGQGSDPNMQMRYTDDGVTWSSWLGASIGKIGETGVRVKWSKLGASANRAFEFRQADPVKTHMFNAFAEVEVLQR